jgi:NAD-dependent deacetylase
MNFLEDYDEYSYEDYFHESGIPEYGCSLEFSLNIQLLNSMIQISDAASWEIPELNVRQESFAHAGFHGTIAGLLQKVDRDVEMMRYGYPPELQLQIDGFLSQIRQLLSGEAPELTREVYHITVRDPSGVSRLINSDDFNKFHIQLSQFERDFFENDSLGLIPDNSNILTPAEQLKDPIDVAKLVLRSNRVVCLSGAGISVESGIPPFRNMNPKDDLTSKSSVAIWSEFDPNLMTVQGFNSNPEIAREWWRMKHTYLPRISSAQPNPAHLFFSYLQSLNKLNSIITQNIDSLHSRSGVSSERIVELHGHMRGLICSNNSSSKYNPIPYGDGQCSFVCSEEDCVKKNFFREDPTPRCPQCQSPLRTETVMFGQPVPSEDLKRAIETITNCDLLFIIGSSLIVQPVNSLPLIAQKMGIPIVMINRDETNYDSYATALINQPAGEFLQAVTNCLQDLQRES